jgi:hypothetical protein
MIGSGTQSQSGWLNRLIDYAGRRMGEGPASTGYGTTGVNPIFGGVDTDGTMAELERFGGI